MRRGRRLARLQVVAAAQKAAETGAAFEAAITTRRAGQGATEAEAAFAKIAADGTAGYRVLARIARDGRARPDRSQGRASAAYDAISDRQRRSVRCCGILPALRAARCWSTPRPMIRSCARLEPLTAADRHVPAHRARICWRLSAGKAGDQRCDKKWVDAILSDGETPAALARAASTMLSALDGATARVEEAR